MLPAENDFLNLVQKAKEILILTPANPSDDAISSAIALTHLLKKQQKNVSWLFNETFPQRLDFLKKPGQIINNLKGARDFVLIFNTQYSKILNLQTEQKEQEYVIRITPEKGSIDPRDFSIIPADFKYDLLIILNTTGLENLGPIYQDNPDLFFEVPKINIDNQSANENFGQVNLIDLAAASICEIVTELVLKHFEKAVDQDIAQALLTGIISATESFQKPTTTPNSMILSAQLMKYKADQPTIIRYLYKTKSLPFLKLWGRVMARLNFDEQKHLVWSFISTEDLVQSRASYYDIPYILERIQESFLEGQIFAIFSNEKMTETVVDLRFSNEKTASQVANLFMLPINSKRLHIVLENKNLIEAEKEFLEKLGLTRLE